MLRVIGKASSINVRKVLWACDEIGVAYARDDDGPALSQNPNGLVPVIVDGDFVLWESNTILRYLAHKWAARTLLPDEPRQRAEVERWIDWQATEFNTAWRYAFSAIVRGNAAYRDAAQTEASRREWNRMAAIVDAASGDGPLHRRHRLQSRRHSHWAFDPSLDDDSDGQAVIAPRCRLLRKAGVAAGFPQTWPQRNSLGRKQ